MKNFLPEFFRTGASVVLALVIFIIPQEVHAQTLDLYGLNASELEKRETSFIPVQQIMNPKIVYVGDEACISYTFTNPVDLFVLCDASKLDKDILQLDVTREAFSSVAKLCTVTEANLQRIGISYTLNVKFIPWITGDIDFPPFDLNEYCRAKNISDERLALVSEENLSVFSVDLEPVKIASMAERTRSLNLRPAASPVLMPGTRRFVFFMTVLVILGLSLILALLIKLHAVLEGMLLCKDFLGHFINVIKTKANLRKLSKNSLGDSDFCLQWQKIMRLYLSRRFNVSFASVTSNKIHDVVCNLNAGLLSDGQEINVVELMALFMRTDYIIFASGSIDSRMEPESEHSSNFLDGEKAHLMDQTYICIRKMENYFTGERK